MKPPPENGEAAAGTAQRAVPTRRWIIIATVKADAQLYGRPGECRRGYWLNWRGRCDWCQPCEFYDWAGVVRAVQTRLRMAGLTAVSWASCPPAAEYVALWVQVERVGRTARSSSISV